MQILKVHSWLWKWGGGKHEKDGCRAFIVCELPADPKMQMEVMRGIQVEGITVDLRASNKDFLAMCSLTDGEYEQFIKEAEELGG